MISEFEALKNYWYIVCLSETLGDQPLARTIVNQPIVFFRDAQGQAHALLDRCCHRSLPLSIGKVTPKGIQCNYHGWEFAPGGQCIRIPGLSAEGNQSLRHCVPTFPVIEQEGLVWVYAMPDAKPTSQPLYIPHRDDEAYDTLVLDFGLVNAPVDNVIDNFMDSLHPPFVHPGLIYSDSRRNPIEILVRPYRHTDGSMGVEGCYLGEPSPTQGLIGKIFAEKTSDPVFHEERYIVPALTQAEYRIGTTTHLLSSHIFTPETENRTRMYVILRTKSRIPKWITRFLLKMLFTKLFRQDIVVLEEQHRAQGEASNLPRASSELDFLSLTCVRFLQQIAFGHPQESIEVKTQRYGASI